MRRRLLWGVPVVLCLLTFCGLLLAGCENTQADPAANVLSVVNESREELDGLAWTLQVDGEAVSGGGCCYADGSPIRPGDWIGIAVDPAELKGNTASLTISVELADRMLPAGTAVLSADGAGVPIWSLTGDSVVGFRLSPKETDA